MLLFITADKGLCGAFNSNLFKRYEAFLKEYQGTPVDVITLGRKGYDYLRKREQGMSDYYLDIFKNISYHWGSTIGEKVVEMYLSGEYREVHLLYNEFKSVIQQRIIVEDLLPVVPAMPEHLAAARGKQDEGTKRAMVDYIYEPSPAAVLGELCPLFVKTRIYHALLESLASEMGARMTAMDNATRSAGDMIDSLTLSYNKLRQAAITTEIMEVVGGAEALRG